MHGTSSLSFHVNSGTLFTKTFSFCFENFNLLSILRFHIGASRICDLKYYISNSVGTTFQCRVSTFLLPFNMSNFCILRFCLNALKSLSWTVMHKKSRKGAGRFNLFTGGKLTQPQGLRKFVEGSTVKVKFAAFFIVEGTSVFVFLTLLHILISKEYLVAELCTNSHIVTRSARHHC